MLRPTSIVNDILVVEAFILVYGENLLIWLQMLNSPLLRGAYICHYHWTIHSNMMENFIIKIRLEFRCCRPGRYSESYQMRYANILMGKKSSIRAMCSLFKEHFGWCESPSNFVWVLNWLKHVCVLITPRFTVTIVVSLRPSKWLYYYIVITLLLSNINNNYKQ